MYQLVTATVQQHTLNLLTFYPLAGGGGIILIEKKQFSGSIRNPNIMQKTAIGKNPKNRNESAASTTAEIHTSIAA
jgi:hypothetical protein